MGFSQKSLTIKIPKLCRGCKSWHLDRCKFFVDCRGVETTASMLFELVSEYGVFGGSGGLGNTRIMQRRCNGLSWFGPIRSQHPVVDDPYTQSTQNLGGYNRV
jgi:hypothetical protein